jgi:hypothetical protein
MSTTGAGSIRVAQAVSTQSAAAQMPVRIVVNPWPGRVARIVLYLLLSFTCPPGAPWGTPLYWTVNDSPASKVDRCCSWHPGHVSRKAGGVAIVRAIRAGKRGAGRATPKPSMTRLMRVYAQQGRHIVRAEGGEALLFGCALATLDDIGRLAVALGIVRLAGIFAGVPLGEAARESGGHCPPPGYNWLGIQRRFLMSYSQ